MITSKQAGQINFNSGAKILNFCANSDTAHYYENLTTYRPFVVQHDIEATLRGYDRLKELAGAVENIVPGHDRGIMDRYPAPNEALRGTVVQLNAFYRPDHSRFSAPSS